MPKRSSDSTAPWSKSGSEGANSTLWKHVGIRIRQRRNYLGMTEESVATQLGINVELLKEYESGENRVPPQVQLELAETLGVSLSYFYFDNPSKYIHQSEIFHAAGEESAQRTPTSEDKSRMLSAMDNMPPDVRKSLVLIAEVIARKDPKPVP